MILQRTDAHAPPSSRGLRRSAVSREEREKDSTQTSVLDSYALLTLQIPITLADIQMG